MPSKASQLRSKASQRESGALPVPRDAEPESGSRKTFNPSGPSAAGGKPPTHPASRRRPGQRSGGQESDEEESENDNEELSEGEESEESEESKIRAERSADEAPRQEAPGALEGSPSYSMGSQIEGQSGYSEPVQEKNLSHIDKPGSNQPPSSGYGKSQKPRPPKPDDLGLGLTGSDGGLSAGHAKSLYLPAVSNIEKPAKMKGRVPSQFNEAVPPQQHGPTDTAKEWGQTEV